MQLKFLPGHDGRNISREHLRHACASCRQKKKRCLHHKSRRIVQSAQVVSDLEREAQESPRVSSPQHRTEQRQPSHISPSIPSAPGSNTSRGNTDPEQFACDTNPVVTLLDDPKSRLPEGQSQRGDVGASLHHECLSPPISEPQPHGHTANESIAHTVPVLPPEPQQQALIDIYFHRLHPILPLLDEEETRSQFATNTLPLPLLQAICLTASKDPRAAPFLSLNPDPALLPLETFARLLHTDIIRNMPSPQERRILTIQTLALLSLHAWGPHGCDEASLALSQAVHHAHTLGLHLAPRPGRKTPSASSPSRTLFWCLWSLDRWNAAVNGRPLLIHDYDMDQEVRDVLALPSPTFSPAFRIWLRIAEHLGWVIRSYRPVRTTYDSRAQDLGLCTFEDLVNDSDGWAIDAEILETLELYHHAVILLSTHSQGLQGRSRPRAAQIRQSQALHSVAALIRRHQRQHPHPHPHPTPPLALAAYTIALAFSVTYSHLKEARLPSARALALEQLDLFHRALRGWARTWWLAAVMAHLGRNALEGVHPQRREQELGRVGLAGDGDGGGGDGCEAAIPLSVENQALAPREIHIDNPDGVTLLPSHSAGDLQGEGLEAQTAEIASLLEGCSALSSSEYGASVPG
ncbi:hypothetical protein BO99DRAFT_433852 [Aspergillus violaceofuscus CBS 115571]|uniref:Xylanolytic transcriptional activator regulatory domain-containing protein n=1 Tax=Aspergillus violaceofuscus (strain CBS 115571) TaxID=1450538 RepID=A0A2V5H7V1_ASPV1|nr:hypothetical protein BO99DRAFT_433852 [Aspergillus violaceofuscus CBS 115571]